MQNPFLRSKCFPLIRLHLALHIVPRIRYLGFTLKGRRLPWLRRRTCPLASPNELLYDNQPSTTYLSIISAMDNGLFMLSLYNMDRRKTFFMGIPIETKITIWNLLLLMTSTICCSSFVMGSNIIISLHPLQRSYEII
jgi:hypothetical protein